MDKSAETQVQFDIDRMIKQSKDWDEFLKKMADLGYEIKHGKLSIKTRKDLQERRLSDKIIRKKDSKKEVQKMPIKRHSPLKSVSEILSTLLTMRRRNQARDMNSGLPNTTYK